MRISRSPAPTIASMAASVVSVTASSSVRQREHPRDVDGDVAVADDDRALAGEVELQILEVRMAVVPGDERGGRPRAGEILAGDAELPVGLRADRVDDRVVQPRQLLVRDVPPDLDVAEEAEPGSRGDPLEGARHRLDVRMVGRDTEADEPPRGRQALDHVDLDRRLLALEERVGGVEPGGAGADDGDAQGSGAHTYDPMFPRGTRLAKRPQAPRR